MQAYYAPRAVFADDSRVDGNRYEFKSLPENPAHRLWLQMLAETPPARHDGYSEKFEASSIPIRERYGRR